MKIILGKTAGFCTGITLAVNRVNEELKARNYVECLGDLLHNNQVLNKLKKEGLHIINNIDEAKENVIIRAHGIEKKVYTYAKENNIKLIDCTCPKVLKIHKLAQELSEKDYYIIVIGEKNHAEIIGTFSFCKRGEIINTIEELKDKIEYINKLEKVAVITQTTYSVNKFKQIEEYLQKNLKITNKIYNCICNATELRQEETEKISKEVECMIIIGGIKSSNTNKLYEIAKNNCSKAIKIEQVEELYNVNLNNINKIGVMAGASTPKEDIKRVINYLKERN